MDTFVNYFNAPTRSERIVFTFNTRVTAENFHLVQLFTSMNIDPGDAVDGTYTFNIDYFGQITNRFNALFALIESGAVVTARVSELNYGRCLLEELLTAIRAVQARAIPSE